MEIVCVAECDCKENQLFLDRERERVSRVSSSSWADNNIYK